MHPYLIFYFLVAIVKGENVKKFSENSFNKN